MHRSRGRSHPAPAHPRAGRAFSGARRGRLGPCLALLGLLAAPAFASGLQARADPPAAQTAQVAGLRSSSGRSLDFRENGFALPMYAVFLASAAAFTIGVRSNIRRWGASLPPSRPGAIRRLLTVALLQARLARRASSAGIHLPLFWGFLTLAAGSFLIMVDSYVLQPLGIAPSRGAGYETFQAILDAAGVALILGVGLAFARRLGRPQAEARDSSGMGPALLALLVLGISGFVLEALRIRMERPAGEAWSFAGNLVARWIGGALPGSFPAMRAYEILWWSHAVLAFALIAAIPFSRLRHVFTAPLNIAVSRDSAAPSLTAPFDLKTLMASGSFDVRVGAAGVGDLEPAHRLALSACADSGRCRDVCPAYESGTALSPQRIVRALRGASESAVPGGGNGIAIFEDLLMPDQVWSCTLCGACARACPVLSDPMLPIVELRRGLVAANRPGKERAQVLSNLSRTGNPYGMPGSERDRLARELGLPTLAEQPRVDLVYWIGCAAAFDPRVRKIAKATAAILKAAGVRVGVLGAEESCTGDPARRIGEEGLFQELALRNIETFERRGVKKILTHCAHCFNTLGNEYAALGARLDVVHHATFLRDLIAEGRIRPVRELAGAAVLHDACYLARFNGIVDEPRAVLRAIPGLRLTEMKRRGEDTFCCGGGGGQSWYQVPRREKMGAIRIREARASGADTLVSECPYCLKMLEDAGASVESGNGLAIRDIAEVVADSLEARAPAGGAS